MCVMVVRTYGLVISRPWLRYDDWQASNRSPFISSVSGWGCAYPFVRKDVPSSVVTLVQSVRFRVGYGVVQFGVIWLIIERPILDASDVFRRRGARTTT